MKSFIAAFAVLALACAQYTPQPGPLSVATVTNGTFYGDLFLPVQASIYQAYHLNIYRFWVPENTSSITLFFNNTYPVDENADCEEINLYVGNNGFIPCSDEEYSPDVFPCAQTEVFQYSYYDNEPVYFTATPAIYTPGYGDIATWSVNTWWYMAVGREYSEDYASACSYSMQVTINSSCPTGELGQMQDLYVDADYWGCSPPYYYQNTSSATWSVGGTEDAVILVDIATNTVGNVHIQVNSSNPDLIIYGSSYSLPTDDEYACGVDDYQSEVGDSLYMYNFYCYTPRQGSFFVTIYNDANDGAPYSVFNATAKIVVQDCGSSGMGGFNCSFPVVACNNSWNNYAVFVPYNDVNDYYVSGAWWYCYIDIPTNTSASTWNLAVSVAANAPDNDYYTSVRKNGFNEYDDEGNGGGWFISSLGTGETNHIGLSVFDIYEPGRYYIGLLCNYLTENSNGCNYTITANSTIAPSTTGGSTTTGGSSTKGSTTTGGGSTTTGGSSTTHASTSTASPVSTTASTGGKTTSSAVVVLPSVFFVFAVLVALLF